MRQTWVMRKGEDVLMSQPRDEAIRSVVVHHTCHHRGQLTVYLRLLGERVPPTFGSTADETLF